MAGPSHGPRAGCVALCQSRRRILAEVGAHSRIVSVSSAMILVAVATISFWSVRSMPMGRDFLKSPTFFQLVGDGANNVHAGEGRHPDGQVNGQSTQRPRRMHPPSW